MHFPLYSINKVLFISNTFVYETHCYTVLSYILPFCFFGTRTGNSAQNHRHTIPLGILCIICLYYPYYVLLLIQYTYNTSLKRAFTNKTNVWYTLSTPCIYYVSSLFCAICLISDKLIFRDTVCLSIMF